MSRILPLIIGVVVLFTTACNDTEDPINDISDTSGLLDVKIDTINHTNNTLQDIEVVFQDQAEMDSLDIALLREINICTTNKDSISNVVSLCSSDNFKLFPLNGTTPKDKAFLVLTKATTGGIALRRTLIFEREGTHLVKVNGFIANLIGIIPSKNKYDDLLLRFKDVEDGYDVFFNCLFTWSEDKYNFVSVERIEYPTADQGGDVRADMKEAVSKEIYQTLLNNKMIF